MSFAPALSAPVAAPLPALPGGDIRDIRGPLSIPYGWLPYAIAAGVVCLLALGYGVYRFVRRRRAERARTAAEVALERIARAAERARAGELSSAELSAAVSDAVRSYIEARFSLRATLSTTEEFLHQLVGASHGPLAAQRDALDDLLSWCDLAKFAQLALTDERVDALVLAARQVVESTAAPLPTPARARRRWRFARHRLAAAEVGS